MYATYSNRDIYQSVQWLGCGLNDREIGVWFRQGQETFLHRVWYSCRSYQASCCGYQSSFPGLRRHAGGTRYRSWLRHYAASRKVAGSIPDEFIGFFNWPNPSSCTMALGSTQPLTEMSTRNLTGGKGRRACKADSLTTLWEPIV
jgi:hypothetical protein